ncbi:hypothetical protein PROFUN_05316 [Planoprotostelium fungivorum]|uniref:General transcription and DNA repair factor IIH subunit TFB5 n=1 Tax=Planoprotostelium fungivorum TaxID=1890364 RepID=A0A2P6NR02_9EUKA|nr:hypothetical protein PROFUN_05316 [Planoprotostelium fungivorum]
MVKRTDRNDSDSAVQQFILLLSSQLNLGCRALDDTHLLFYGDVSQETMEMIQRKLDEELDNYAFQASDLKDKQYRTVKVMRATAQRVRSECAFMLVVCAADVHLPAEEASTSRPWSSAVVGDSAVVSQPFPVRANCSHQEKVYR